jgi:hypothetical protein
MKTEELIKILDEYKGPSSVYLSNEVLNEIIKRLEELEGFREEKKAEDATWK